MSDQLVRCEFVCERVRSTVAWPSSARLLVLVADGVLRLPDGRELRRPMPLRNGLSLTPGAYSVDAYVGPIFRIVSAEPVNAQL